MTGDPDRAEELAQETYLRLYKHPPTSTTPGQILAWLRTTARRLKANQVLRHVAPATLSLDELGG